jgi:hypothetical protein
MSLLLMVTTWILLIIKTLKRYLYMILQEVLSRGKNLLGHLPEVVRNTALIRLFGLGKVPMIFYLSPTVHILNDQKCVLEIKYGRRSKNHLHSLYFGALAVGADCAAGLHAMRFIDESGKRIDLSFKDFHAQFFKRAHGDTLFTSEQGPEVQELVRKAIETKERVEMPVIVTATVPKMSGGTPVAKFTLTLSIKCR